MNNLTLHAILFHEFERFIMSKSRAEIVFMRDILLVILKCGKVLELYSSHRLKEITPERREQSGGKFTPFLECPWAHESIVDGPDTCVCCHVTTQCCNIIKLLDED